MFCDCLLRLNFIFLGFCVFATSLLRIMWEVAGGASVAVAVSDMGPIVSLLGQSKNQFIHISKYPDFVDEPLILKTYVFV